MSEEKILSMLADEESPIEAPESDEPAVITSSGGIKLSAIAGRF